MATNAMGANPMMMAQGNPMMGQQPMGQPMNPMMAQMQMAMQQRAQQ